MLSYKRSLKMSERIFENDKKKLKWVVLACLVVPMFASYFFDDMFSTLSHLFENPALLELGWNSSDYGLYTSGYSVLCIFGGLVICGMLLDRLGVRITGSIFVGIMVLGAGMVAIALTGGYIPKMSLRLAYIGCMLFGLGSEIAGVAVTRSIAKWFKGGSMSLAMGLQLAIARLGTALALIFSPVLVHEKSAGEVYTLVETAKPAFFGLGLMALGIVLWVVFVIIDARADKFFFLKSRADEDMSDDRANDIKEDSFRFSDVLKLLGNKQFLMIAFLCVFFYSSIIAFKKFASAILIPRFDIPVETASLMVSMLPFATVIFAPLFGVLVDKVGKGTRWMVIGALLALAAHILLAFAPQGVRAYGYISMVFLGFAYSLVPAAMWPSVPKIVPANVLGTAFALIYWVQNLGLMSFKMISGNILAAHSANSEIVNYATDSIVGGAFRVELMFVCICIIALLLSFLLMHSSKNHPEMELDLPNNK